MCARVALTSHEYSPVQVQASGIPVVPAEIALSASTVHIMKWALSP